MAGIDLSSYLLGYKKCFTRAAENAARIAAEIAARARRAI